MGLAISGAGANPDKSCRVTQEMSALAPLLTSLALSSAVALPPCDPDALPGFEQFSVQPESVDTPRVDLDSDPIGRRFATRLEAAADSRLPDLAGHYLVVDWSCGTSCEMFAIIDLWSGRIWHDAELILTRGIETRSDSRLVILNPGPASRAEDTPSRYYLWQSSTLEGLCEIRLEYSVSAESGSRIP